MAVTLSIKRVIAGNHKRIIGTITGPASYTNPGGEALTAAQIKQLTDGLSGTSLASVTVFDGEVDATNFRTPVLDKTNKKVIFVAGATQVTNGTDLSGLTVGFEAVLAPVNG